MISNLYASLSNMRGTVATQQKAQPSSLSGTASADAKLSSAPSGATALPAAAATSASARAKQKSGDPMEITEDAPARVHPLAAGAHVAAGGESRQGKRRQTETATTSAELPSIQMIAVPTELVDVLLSTMQALSEIRNRPTSATSDIVGLPSPCAACGCSCRSITDATSPSVAARNVLLVMLYWVKLNNDVAQLIAEKIRQTTIELSSSSIDVLCDVRPLPDRLPWPTDAHRGATAESDEARSRSSLKSVCILIHRWSGRIETDELEQQLHALKVAHPEGGKAGRPNRCWRLVKSW